MQYYWDLFIKNSPHDLMPRMVRPQAMTTNESRPLEKTQAVI